jgi:hypothetical protein
MLNNQYSLNNFLFQPLECPFCTTNGCKKKCVGPTHSFLKPIVVQNGHLSG